jgi:hypothetical protein
VGEDMLKTKTPVLPVVLLLVISSITIGRAAGSVSFELSPTENHHVMKLNSDQPYVAGYHVNAKNLSVYGTILATAITVSFPSTDTRTFPPGSWLGGGMFVQAQDTRFRHVDYGFYMMLVLDASGRLFIDLGLHQTREGTLPFQFPTEDVVYAYTWQVTGISLATKITLYASWDNDGFVHYSISALSSNFALTSVNVAGLPNCENIIRKFYLGNVIVEPFPFSRYVNYFQFGVVSSESIANSDWTVDLAEPKMLKETGWVSVERAWSTQGDISYLDADWRWGGVPYYGVNAQYWKNPLENPYEIVFYYDGSTLTSGTVLWDYTNSDLNETANTMSPYSDQTFEVRLTPCFLTGTTILALAFLVETVWHILATQIRRHHESIKQNNRSHIVQS